MPDSAQTHRIFYPVTIALISVIFLLFAAPAPDYEPRGIVLPAKEIEPPITDLDTIRVFTIPPITYRTLGVVRIEQYYSQTNPAAKGQLLELAKQLSAQVGANAVLLLALFPTPLTTEVEGEVIYNLRALAISIPTRPFDFDKGQEL